MSYSAVLAESFPGTVSQRDFVSRSYQALLGQGFTQVNSLAMVASCRDELLHSLHEDIQRTWGNAFNLAGLGGMIFAGKTGFAAARDHAPNLDGRERYIFYALAHIAIDGDGTVGVTDRRGRSGKSVACGALLALQAELAAGSFMKTDMDMTDVEYSLLRWRMAPHLQSGTQPDLISLTRLANTVMLEDLEKMISLTLNPGVSDFAVLSGILIHGPGLRNDICTTNAYACVHEKQVQMKI